MNPENQDSMIMTDGTLLDNDELIRRLSNIPALKSFGELEIRALLQLSCIRQFRDGDRIFEEGAKSRLAYYLISGKVKIVKKNKELMTLQRTGDVFGEIGAIEGGRRTASVVAVGDTLCVELDISGVEERSDENHLLFRYMIFRGFSEILAHRLRVTTEELVALRNEVAVLRGGKEAPLH